VKDALHEAEHQTGADQPAAPQHEPGAEPVGTRQARGQHQPGHQQDQRGRQQPGDLPRLRGLEQPGQPGGAPAATASSADAAGLVPGQPAQAVVAQRQLEEAVVL
jgi:hypothetical protein